MSFAAVGSFCDANSTTPGTTFVITPSATLNAGNLGVLNVSMDNIEPPNAASSYGPESSQVLSVVDSVGNTWEKLLEVNQEGATAGQVTGSYWMCIPDTDLTTADTITVTFAYGASVTSKAATGHEYTIGAGPISIEKYTHEISTAADFGSLTLADLPSREYLLLRLGAKEGNVAGASYTPSTNYTPFTHTNATADTGTASSSVLARGEYRIATLTSDTTDPNAGSAAGAVAAVYLALYEGDPYPVETAGAPSPTGETVATTIDWPADHRTNDVLVVGVETSAGETIATPSGFTQAPDSPQDDGDPGGPGSGTRLSVYYGRATSAAMGSVDISDAGNHAVVAACLLRGCVTSGSPLDVTAGDVQTTSDTTVEIPGDTTTVDNTLVVAIVSTPFDIGAKQITGFTNADLTHLREVIFAQDLAGNGGGLAIAVGRKAVAGSYGTTTATLANAASQARWSGAFKPEPGGAPPTMIPVQIHRQRRVRVR